MSPHGWVRRIAGIVLIVLLAELLAACASTGSSPTATPLATRTATTPTATAAPPTRPAAPVASPVASPVGAPAGASPVAGNTLGSTVSREQFQAQLKAAYPMEPAANSGGSVILGESADVSTVNPLLASDTLSIYLAGTMFETLVGFSPIDGTPVPGLADSWEVAPDGLTYTFRLNQQAKWHDGVDITAEDVAFSFASVLDPNSGYTYTTLVNQAVASYRAIDADTFELVARDKLVSFLYNAPGLVFIVPQHIWGGVDVANWSFDGGSTGQDPARVVGSGPFKFKEWIQGERITVARNDAYYDVVPTIDAFTLVVQPDAEAAVLALQGGESDIMEIIPAAQTQTVIDTPGRKVNVYNRYDFTFYAMNLDASKSPYFTTKEVRQALFTALDRDAITQNIFFGYGEPAVGTQPPLSPAYAPDRMTPAYRFDVAGAKATLAQAGWTDSNGDGTVDKDGQEFKFDLLYSGGDATVESLVNYLQDAWKAVGVDANLQSVQGQGFQDRLKAGDFDMVLLGFSLSPDSDQGLLFACDSTRNGFNFMRYCNPNYDALQEQVEREFDPAKRTELLIEQSQLLWDEQPVGPLRFGIARTGYSTRIHNFYPNGYGFLWSLPYIWVDPAS